MVGLLVCMLFLTVLIALTEDGWLTPAGRLIGGLVLLGLSLIISLVLAIRLRQEEKERTSLRSALQTAQDQMAQANQRLEAVLQVNRNVIEASDEKEIVDFLLQVVIQLTGAAGASYVPLDEHSQPLSVIHKGEQPVQVGDEWLEYLASPAVRSRCSACTSFESDSPSCPLLRGPFTDSRGVFCLPLRRGKHEYGILNVFLPARGSLDIDTRQFLDSIVDETTLAIEGVRLRERELESYHQLELARQKTDLNAGLQDLLDGLCQALSADYGILEIQTAPPVISNGSAASEVRLESGQSIGIFDRSLVDTLIKSGPPGGPVIVPVLTLPISAREQSPEGEIVVTMLTNNRQEQLGFLLIGSSRLGAFLPRQLPLVQTTAAQAVLLVENIQKMAEVQVKTMLEERNRLAREIHDGLAQTIGYLKLQMAQMQIYLDHGEKDRLQEALKKSYQAVSAAYQEARYAIDGLRATPGDDLLNDWLRQIVDDFRTNFAGELSVSLEFGEISARIPSEVQVQLIRIVQEALSNIRKHAQARNIWIGISMADQVLNLEIRDDGQGFQLDEITGPSRHGLEGMRERADLIGATLQVISLAGQGTKVVVRLPISSGEVVG